MIRPLKLLFFRRRRCWTYRLGTKKQKTDEKKELKTDEAGVAEDDEKEPPEPVVLVLINPKTELTNGHLLAKLSSS